jgi:hypothetical protein
METGENRRPRGFVPLGVFFLFGTTMTAYAAVTLLKPGTTLDRLWTVPKAHPQCLRRNQPTDAAHINAESAMKPRPALLPNDASSA